MLAPYNSPPPAAFEIRGGYLKSTDGEKPRQKAIRPNLAGRRVLIEAIATALDLDIHKHTKFVIQATLAGSITTN